MPTVILEDTHVFLPLRGLFGVVEVVAALGDPPKLARAKFWILSFTVKLRSSFGISRSPVCKCSPPECSIDFNNFFPTDKGVLIMMLAVRPGGIDDLKFCKDDCDH